MTDKQAQAVHRQMADTERLLLNALAENGYSYKGGKVTRVKKEAEKEQESVEKDGEVRYNRDGIYIDDKEEYAVLSSALAEKNGRHPRSVEYAYTANNFYVVKNNRYGNFTPVLQLDIESNREFIDFIRSEIDNGTYKHARTVAEWVRLVQRRARRYGVDYDGASKGSADGQVDRLYGKQSDSNTGNDTRQSGGNQDGQSNNVRRFSRVTPEQDRAYTSLAEKYQKGTATKEETQELERMVEEAARAALPLTIPQIRSIIYLNLPLTVANHSYSWLFTCGRFSFLPKICYFFCFFS